MRRRFRVSVPVRLAAGWGSASLIGCGLGWWLVEASTACAPDCWWLEGWWWLAFSVAATVGVILIACALAALMRWGAES